MIKKTYFFIFLFTAFSFYGINEIALPEEVYEIPEDFRENYTDEAYDYSTKEPGWWFYFKQRLLHWVISLLRAVNPAANVGTVWYYIKNGLLFLVILAAVYYICKFLFYKDGQWIFKRRLEQEEDINFEENIEENLAKINFKNLIDKANDNEQYRLAVRYYYLWVLKKLDQLKVIEIDNQKTNIDYIYELEGKKLEQDFKQASYFYNYIWYGEFEIDKEKYEVVKSSFEQTLNKIA